MKGSTRAAVVGVKEAVPRKENKLLFETLGNRLCKSLGSSETQGGRRQRNRAQDNCEPWGQEGRGTGKQTGRKARSRASVLGVGGQGDVKVEISGRQLKP